MARPGYVQAKNAVYDAQAAVAASETELAAVDTLTINGQELIPKIREIHRADRQKWLDQAKARLEEAEKAFAVFSNRRVDVPAREYFDVQVFTCVSMSSELHSAFKNRLQTEGVSKPELFRRALRAYLSTE